MFIRKRSCIAVILGFLFLILAINCEASINRNSQNMNSNGHIGSACLPFQYVDGNHACQPKLQKSDICQKDEQCLTGFCKPVDGKCDCPFGSYYEDTVCKIKRGENRACVKHEECAENMSCQSPKVKEDMKQYYYGTCLCNPGYVYYPDLNRCDKMSTPSPKTEPGSTVSSLNSATSQETNPSITQSNSEQSISSSFASAIATTQTIVDKHSTVFMVIFFVLAFIGGISCIVFTLAILRICRKNPRKPAKKSPPTTESTSESRTKIKKGKGGVIDPTVGTNLETDPGLLATRNLNVSFAPDESIKRNSDAGTFSLFSQVPTNANQAATSNKTKKCDYFF